MEVKQKFEDAKADIYARYYGIKWNAKKKFNDVKKWCEEHPDLAIATGSAIVIGAKGIGRITRSIDRKIDMAKQQKLMDERIYVPSLHKHVTLTRPMSKYETIEYERRKEEGESIVTILYDMGLLK